MQAADSSLGGWNRPLWLALLIVSSVLFSFGFSCATPFVAFSVVAALTLPRREAYYLTGGVWLANQVVGFLFLHYPLDATTLAWGMAIGVAAFLSTLAAQYTVSRLDHLSNLLCGVAAFLAAFAANEAAIYGTALLLGGTQDFTVAIKSWIMSVNALALVGLLVLARAGSALRIAPVVGPRRVESHA